MHTLENNLYYAVLRVNMFFGGYYVIPHFSPRVADAVCV